MADRFPSLDDFDAGAPIEATGDDFLTREKALLGDDAEQFATGNDNAAFVTDGDDDLLGGGAEEVTEFESSYPAIDSQNEGVAPGGTITGTPSLLQSQSNYHAPSFGDDYEEETEPIKQWRAQRDAGLAERAERSEEKKQATIKAAQSAIDDFYENYNSKKEKAIAQTRREAEEFLESREDTSSGGTSWERISKLVDLSGKGTKGGASESEKAKFRDLLISLKKDEKAPGATGY